MTFNKSLKTAIAFLLFVSTSSMAKAGTDSAAIKLSLTYAPYVKLTGTAPDASRFYDNSDVYNFLSPANVNLGTLGLESSMSGLCDVSFSTLHNFKLINTDTENNLF